MVSEITGRYLIGAKPVSVEVAESVLSKKLDDLKPTLIRHGYKMVI